MGATIDNFPISKERYSASVDTVFNAPASAPHAHGRQPEPSNNPPHPPSCRITSVIMQNPHACIYSMVRKAPMRRAANRANKSAEPQQTAVANPSKMPMIQFYGLDFFGSARPSSTITFCRSFHTSAFAGGFRNRYAG